MEPKKGIELVNTGKSSEVSITIGNSTFKHEGAPTGMRFEQEIAYVYLAIDTLTAWQASS